MKAFDLNIALVEDDGKTENFYYQRFTDEPFTGKVREVIRVVNDFPPLKPFRFGSPQLTIDCLNGMTDDARAMADQTGASLNWELLKILNIWINENL